MHHRPIVSARALFALVLWASFMGLLATAGAFAATPETPWPVIRLSPRQIRQLLRTRSGMVMPDLRVFDAKGRLVFVFAGDHRDLIPTLTEMLAHPVPLHGPGLSTWLNPREAQRLIRHEPSNGLIFMELWASWNPACQREYHALKRFMATHPAWPIRGIRLSVDTVPLSTH